MDRAFFLPLTKSQSVSLFLALSITQSWSSSSAGRQEAFGLSGIPEPHEIANTFADAGGDHAGVFQLSEADRDVKVLRYQIEEQIS